MRTHTNSKNGSAMVAAMIVALALASAGAAILSLTSQHTYTVGRVRQHVQAQAIAEAGANEAYSILKADFSQRGSDGAFPATAFAGGSYDATVTPVGNNAAVIQCIGTYNGVSAEVVCDVVENGTPPVGTPGSPGTDPFSFAILAGSIVFGGNGQTVINGGDVQANTTYEMNGTPDLVCDTLKAVTSVRSVGNCTITGDAESLAYANASPANISGAAVVGPVDIVPIPQIDLTPYYQYALANGEVYASDPGSYTPNGGIMWVDGDVSAAGGAAIVGCIIATGDIKVTGNCSHSQVANFPALISRDAGIELNSCSEFFGLIYAPNGDIKMTGGGKVSGTVMCGGEYWKNGGWDQVAYIDSTPPIDPTNPTASGPTSDVGISCWHK